MTPAQASGHPNFVTDWPVQGPTDPGIRAADCLFAQTKLPTPQQAACVDCKGPIPMWTQSKGLLGEQIAFGGARARGFSLAAAGDPDAWVQLNTAQQQWVSNALVTLDAKIRKATGTTCPMFGPNITGAATCFQNWFNSAKLGLTKRDGTPLVLRTDGVFDQDTLDALRTVAALNAKDFPTPFPGTEMPGLVKTGLSGVAKAGIATAAVAVLGGGIYVATRGKKKSRRH